MRVEVGGWAGGGRCVARSGGKVWFVADAIPGEEVEADAARERAGIVEARAVTIWRASELREPHPCPVAATCGGCDLAHVRRDGVAEVLRAVVLGGLRHALPELNAAAEHAKIVVSPMRWRLRARLHWDGAAGRLGFFAAHSHDVVDISTCTVVSPRLLASLPYFAHALSEAGAQSGDLEWLEDLAGAEAVAGWWGEDPVEVPAREGLAGFRVLGRATGESGWGADGVTMALPVPLRVPIGAFFQGNRHLVPALFARAAALIAACGAARVIDLYGGVGLFGAAATHAGVADVTIVEGDTRAAAAARNNVPSARVVDTSCEIFLMDPPAGVGALAVVDPPRSGLSDSARRRLVAWAPDHVLFLGCEPSRFGRDARALLDAGYILDLVEIWDLFGGSHHAEILATFRRGRA